MYFIWKYKTALDKLQDKHLRFSNLKYGIMVSKAEKRIESPYMRRYQNTCSIGGVGDSHRKMPIGEKPIGMPYRVICHRTGEHMFDLEKPAKNLKKLYRVFSHRTPYILYICA